jgi:hypothetical protein
MIGPTQVMLFWLEFLKLTLFLSLPWRTWIAEYHFGT